MAIHWASESGSNYTSGHLHGAFFLFIKCIDRIIHGRYPQFSSWMSSGINSIILSTIIVGLVTQFWLRQYHPGWFKQYNYLVGGALDGGSAIMIFLLSFAVFGASGDPKPFPAWAGNPVTGNIDYCNGNGALAGS